MNENSVCKSCGIKKPLEDFRHSKKDNGAVFINPKCKKCCEKPKIYTPEQKQQRKKRKHKWYYKDHEASKKRSRRYSKNRLNKRYNIDFDLLFEQQEGKCKACGEPEKATYKNRIKSLAVDHNHKTGKFRGLICQGCNITLGVVNDDIEYLKKLIKYLEENEISSNN